jgi:hypothetical protein
MKDPASRRIYSTHANDPEFEERLDRFVVELAERIDAAQDAHLAGDLETLAKQATELGEDAETLGYPQLAEATRRLAQACAAAGGEETLACLVEITDLGRSIRLGHRGAF